MKTWWSQSYLDSKMSPSQQHAWRQQKAKDLQGETGVPWSHSSQNGKVVFRPVLDAKNVVPNFSEELTDRVVEGWESATAGNSIMGIAAFDKISLFSGLSLPEVMAGALALVRNGRAEIHVDRMGRATFLKVKRGC